VSKTRVRVAALGFTLALSVAGRARAETTLVAPGDGWEVYTGGRVGAFVEVLQGDGVPATPSGVTLANEGVTVLADPGPDGTPNAGHVLASRVRSGFLGNILTLGLRRKLFANTTLSAQISIWGTAETDSGRTFLKNLPDEREGYLQLDGPAGRLLVGRALSLFSRGATEIDFLYGHGYAVGAPSGFSDFGPSGGHIGYGVLASVFAAGVAYATPSFYGLTLTAGYYDPGNLVGQYYGRTKLGRPEAEATFDTRLGTIGKLHVFANGAYQKLYATQKDDSTSVYGAGAGVRLELGPFHLGVAAHTGKGLGVNYFLNQTDSIVNHQSFELRWFDGAYVQTQTVVGKFDFNAGIGITRAHQLTADIDPKYFNAQGLPPYSYLKSQLGISGVVVYHITDNLHAALDYFRSDVKWWLGQQQVLNSFNAGMTVTW
jgi:hypothetical protein